jgi:ubiquinone/menaquinone biosynthesis C-methylase UbiE
MSLRMGTPIGRREERYAHMASNQLDPVKQQVAAHWDRRAPHFDDDFGHSVRTPGERAAWDRVLDAILAGRGRPDVLDVGCGTGFLAFELAARGHRATGVDFAPAMVAEARRKAVERGLDVRFEEGDAEQLAFPDGSFDLVISRHVLWTLPHPEAAVDEWIRVLRPGGRLAIVDGQFGAGPRTDEYATIADLLPFNGGRSQEEIEALLSAHGLVHVTGDPFLDLIEAQRQRAAAEGRSYGIRARYAVWGDKPA